MDNLLAYLKRNLPNHLLISGEQGDLLVWGERDNNDVHLLGISYNGQINQNGSESISYELLRIGKKTSDLYNIPFMHIQYPIDLDTKPDKFLVINKIKIELSDAAEYIQKFLGTDGKIKGTNKEVNKSTNDAFHKWARSNLPQNYIRVDIDALLISSENMPKAILEIKRSTQVNPANWKPYVQDARNYMIQKKLAYRLKIPYVTLNHNCLFTAVEDKTLIGRHEINAVSLDPLRITSNKQLIQATNVVYYLKAILEYTN